MLAALALVVVGCSKPEDKFVGHYNGKVELGAETKQKIAALPPEAKKQAESNFQNIKVDLDLRQDKSYTFNLTIPSASFSVTGVWELKGNKINCINKQETVNGKTSPVTGNRADVLTVGSNPSVLTMDSASNSQLAGITITLTKSS